ncbi:MAG: GNAT family N-acetyltransferase [Litoreibacter sp.]|nr:GNAT family N-acetyltransferase [Litoreibacter sp.]
MITRKAIDEDIPQLVEILNEVIAIGGTTAYQDPVDAAYFVRLVRAADPRTFIHVAVTGSHVEGFQWISPNPEREDLATIATFARPGTVQRGIGTALFSATKTAAKDAGYGEIDATIRADNSGGLAYYSKMGFKDHSVTNSVPLKDGTPVDRIHKRLPL